MHLESASSRVRLQPLWRNLRALEPSSPVSPLNPLSLHPFTRGAWRPCAESMVPGVRHVMRVHQLGPFRNRGHHGPRVSKPTAATSTPQTHVTPGLSALQRPLCVWLTCTLYMILTSLAGCARWLGLSTFGACWYCCWACCRTTTATACYPAQVGRVTTYGSSSNSGRNGVPTTRMGFLVA